MTAKKRKSSLGNNPLDANPQFSSIFQKTDGASLSSQSHQVSIIKNIQSSFLNKEVEKEKVNLRLPLELNDWLDDTVKKGKRLNGHKIPKEVWVQAALELFRSVPIHWAEIDSIEKLQETLISLSDKLNEKNRD